MKIRVSTAAHGRQFSKAMRRARSKYVPLLDRFDLIPLEHPVFEAILIIVTDDKKPGFMEEVENDDGYFQVIAGCEFDGSDDRLTEDVFSIVRRAVRECPFAASDAQRFEEFFDAHKANFLTDSGETLGRN